MRKEKKYKWELELEEHVKRSEKEEKKKLREIRERDMEREKSINEKRDIWEEVKEGFEELKKEKQDEGLKRGNKLYYKEGDVWKFGGFIMRDWGAKIILKRWEEVWELNVIGKELRVEECKDKKREGLTELMERVGVEKVEKMDIGSILSERTLDVIREYTTEA